MPFPPPQNVSSSFLALYNNAYESIAKKQKSMRAPFWWTVVLFVMIHKLCTQAAVYGTCPGFMVAAYTTDFCVSVTPCKVHTTGGS